MLGFSVQYFRRATLIGKAIQTDRPIVFLMRDQGSWVALCVQDYKSLCASVMIWATVVNVRTDTYTAEQGLGHPEW